MSSQRLVRFIRRLTDSAAGFVRPHYGVFDWYLDHSPTMMLVGQVHRFRTATLHLKRNRTLPEEELEEKHPHADSGTPMARISSIFIPIHSITEYDHIDVGG